MDMEMEMEREPSFDETEKEKYEEFQERVKRTVYVSNLSPKVTETILRAAFDQFFKVKTIKFIRDYLTPEELSCAALVELETEQAVKTCVREVSNSPLMIGGKPRPVVARPAEEGMFEDRPRNPARKITFQWLSKDDPNYEIAMKMKHMAITHTKEANALLEYEREDEATLAKRQEEQLELMVKKYDLICDAMRDGSLQLLAAKYNMKLRFGD